MTLLDMLERLPPLRPLTRRIRKKAERARWLRHQAHTAAFRDCCRAIAALVPEPFFVKVGAHDGMTGDPCSDILLAETRWRGLLIEPVPSCFARLQKNFGDASRFALEQVAVGAGRERATFYFVAPHAREQVPELPDYFDQLGSFDRTHILKHCKGALKPFIREMQVRVVPLSEIMQRHGIGTCHLLHVDTEGHDLEVLQTLDFAAVQPWAIFIEHDHLSDAKKAALQRLFRKHGYAAKDCGRDYFAVSRRFAAVSRGPAVR